MKNYVKPVVLANEELAEGVYAASGDCYTVSGYIHQKPELGRNTFVAHFDGVHSAADGHHSGAQTLIITFNQPVTYKSSNGTLVSGDGTNVISIDYKYHNNGNDNIGLGDVYVESEDGLAIMGAVLTCNHHCFDGH